MASAHVIFGKVKSGQPVMDIDFGSQVVANNATSTACPSNYNFVEVTAVGGDIYLAFGPSVANSSATTDPRYLLPSGTKVKLSCPVGTKVAVSG